MSTILPKEPVITDRESVILSNAERRHLRRKLLGSVSLVQKALSPRRQLKRLVKQKTDEAKLLAVEAARITKKNRPIIALIGSGALLFAARRPISRWISRIRKSKTTPDGI